ncbi:LysE/ArgO family amino acid transporter [Methylibium sp.]|uniref:LysE/ArgO family amino acid transporter n=1 Tax=Methylibium sp. TaxID=2067992 RepID=UPI003D0B086A
MIPLVSPLDPAVPAAALQGALMMAGLIVAIGAQNALVLRQGVMRAHVLPVVVTCALSDGLLVALGVFGLGALIAAQPLLLEAFRYGGAAFLAVYGWRAAHQAWRGGSAGLQLAGVGGSLGGTLTTTLALTYLNPHVYLDTVVLVGGVGAQHVGAARLGFVAGAWAASAAWFALLGFGAAGAARFLRQPSAWRAIDALVAVVMWAVAAQLLLTPLTQA